MLEDDEDDGEEEEEGARWRPVSSICLSNTLCLSHLFLSSLSLTTLLDPFFKPPPCAVPLFSTQPTLAAECVCALYFRPAPLVWAEKGNSLSRAGGRGPPIGPF